MTVAVLFARADSNYRALPDVDVWDARRDARRFGGGMPVVAHPPCRAWASLRHFARPEPGEKELALFAVEMVRKCGGVLEHPALSTLFQCAGLPAPGRRDRHGGFVTALDQFWFGHRAEKRTKLYIVGIEPQDLPAMPMRIDTPTHVVSPSARLRAGMPGYRPQLRKAEREHTPPHWPLGWSMSPSAALYPPQGASHDVPQPHPV